MQVDNSVPDLQTEGTEQRVKRFIEKQFRVAFTGRIGADTDFFDEGLIDSYGFIELVKFLEAEFKIRFDDDELLAAQLNTINNIANTVNKKLKG